MKYAQRIRRFAAVLLSVCLLLCGPVKATGGAGIQASSAQKASMAETAALPVEPATGDRGFGAVLVLAGLCVLTAVTLRRRR